MQGWARAHNEARAEPPGRWEARSRSALRLVTVLLLGITLGIPTARVEVKSLRPHLTAPLSAGGDPIQALRRPFSIR